MKPVVVDRGMRFWIGRAGLNYPSHQLTEKSGGFLFIFGFILKATIIKVPDASLFYTCKVSFQPWWKEFVTDERGYLCFKQCISLTVKKLTNLQNYSAVNF